MECVVLYSISCISFHLSIEVFVYIFVNPNSLRIILQKRMNANNCALLLHKYLVIQMMVCKSLFWTIFWIEVSVQVSNLYFKKIKYCQNFQFYVKYDNFLLCKNPPVLSISCKLRPRLALCICGENSASPDL